MTTSLTDGQAAVLVAFQEFGPQHDEALAAFIHHHSDVSMSSSGIRTRRAELTRFDPPLVQAVGTRRMKSGRNAAVHGLTPDGRRIAAMLNPAPLLAA
jgi:hypothetical protein